MFFVLVSTPFIHLDKNIVQLEKFTNSSLDIYYTNQKKTKASECNECAGICDDEERADNKNELYIPLLDPLKLKVESKKMKSIIIEYLVIKNEYFDCSINGQKFDNEEPLNLIQVDVEGKIKHHVLKNESDIIKLFKSTKDNTYIILITSGKLTIKNTNYNLDIDFKSDESTSITIVFKSQDEYNPVLRKYNKSGLSHLHGYKLFDNRNFKMINFQGKIYDEPVKLESEKKYIYKNSLISSHNTKTKQYLVFSNENNQSFVYLSGSTNQLELYDYKKTDGNEIMDITLLNTNNPQKWDIEFVQANFGGQNFYIKTSSYPTFYLEVVDNEIKMNMYKGSSNQYWKLNKTSGKNLFTIQHSKTGMFLSYQMSDGYLYKNNGSVYLTESGMEWNIESNTIIDKSLTISDNDWIEITSPNDFVNEGKPIFDLKGRINGKMINLSSNGRTTWNQKYSPIWNGDYIYYGTNMNYNSNIFKCFNNILTPIRINNNGNVECVAVDGKTCLWSNNIESCNNLIKQYENSSQLKPFICGEMDKSTWRSTGYNFNNYWCALGKKQLMESSNDLNINKNTNYLTIKLDKNGNGTVKDPYLGITINVVNIGADILYGKIRRGNLNGINLHNFTVILEMIPEKYEYRGIKESYPVKIRYLLIGDNKIYSLGSSSLDNLDSYATKKEGNVVIYSNLLEAKGIQVDEKLAKPKFK
jgi:hypothetical protein